MIKLKKIGFFRDLPYGTPDAESIRSSSSCIGSEETDKIIAYLKSGAMLIASPGLSRDVLSETQTIIGSLKLLTDGVFLWPSDLSYYLEKYSVELPQEFMRHIEENDWVVPTGIDINDLEL